MSEDQRPASVLLSVIIPTLNEAASIGATLDAVARVRGQFEIIVVDGGSDDGTPVIAGDRGVRGAGGAAGSRLPKGVT